MDLEASHSFHSTVRASSISVGNRPRNGSISTVLGAAVEDFNSLIVSFYTRGYPSAEVFADEAAGLDLEDINEAVTELSNEVSALQEETLVLGVHAQALQQRRPGGGTAANSVNIPVPTTGGLDPLEADAVTDPTGGAPSPVDVTVTLLGGDYELNMGTLRPTGGGSATEIGGSTAGGATRRGRSYRRRSLAEAEAFMRVDDKAALLRQEPERLRIQEEKAAKEMEGVYEVLIATVEEAIRRRQELRLERIQFEREVMHCGDAEVDTEEASDISAAVTADELLRYLERRYSTQVNYLDKLNVQCQAAEQGIARAQQLVRERRIAGEAFQAVDMEQLRIEQKQLSERMETKNNELAELKGTSTRTVQQLNRLMGQLNELVSEQARLKREAKSRSEYLSRCGKEISTATTEAAQAESKHMTLKSQQEAVKVPKIEEYMAQKAEEVELERAVRNLERKVQIAEGQAAVVRQQVRRLESQRIAAINYAKEKQHKRHLATSGGGAAAAAASRPVVGGARGLILHRRQQQQQQKQQEQQEPQQEHQQEQESLPQERTGNLDENGAAAEDQPATAAATAATASSSM
ncbi:hypothetical protein JKF63_06726 [Porcisia hertigi]|uniref:Cilia- and flagella-associated protein 263 n=1 Tax=Porcisia hertigi TaxID=2761500 RepID=A0A836IDM8_9TRYP|nr:hypothetical protein JKF63_06726 [Porcisia hertigi]